jgi:beta-xylosidase
MKVAVFAAILMAATVSIAAGAPPHAQTSSTEVLTYTNPLQVFIADPFVLYDEGTYYLYGTGSALGFEVYTSADLVNWRKRGMCYTPTWRSWGDHHFWAPEVFKDGDTFYFYYTARNKTDNVRNVGVATSKSPLGPFQELKAPLFAGHSVIDPHVYRAPDGATYIYATDESTPTRSRILGARLAPNMADLASTLTDCLVSGETWERNWIEAPFILERNGVYYMMYSASAYDRPSYAIGYATARHPLGPYTKYEGNPIVSQRGSVHGPGHHSVTMSPDGSEMIMAYHVHQTPWLRGRMLAIDRLRFVDQPGGLALLEATLAPTETPQPIPSGAKPMRTAVSDEFESDTLDRTYWTIYEEDEKNWRLEKGSVVLTATHGDFFREENDAKNLFLQYAPEGDFDIEARIHFTPVDMYDQAALVVWQDADNYVKTVMLDSSGLRLEAGIELLGKYDVYLVDSHVGTSFNLKIEKRGDEYTCFGSPDGSEWRQIGLPLSAEFTTPMVGFGAFLPAAEEGRNDARFEYFRVTRH